MASVRMAPVPRTDLVEPFITALVNTTLGIVEGGPGFGRSTLLRHIAEAWPHEHLLAGGIAHVRQAAAMVDRPRLIVVDDAERLEPQARTLLAELAADLPPIHRLVIATTGACPELRALADAVPGPRIRPGRMLFSIEELERRLWKAVRQPARVAEAVHGVTGGWAEGVQLALAAGPDLWEGGLVVPVGADVVAGRVRTLPLEQRVCLARALMVVAMREGLLGLLPHGQELIGALLQARVPVVRIGRDEWAILPPLDDLLPRLPLELPLATRLARRCVEMEHPEEGFQLLWGNGYLEAAMDLLETASGSRAEALLSEWRGPADVTEADIARTPVAAERLLRAAELVGHTDRTAFRRQAQAHTRTGVALGQRSAAWAARALLQRGHTTAAAGAAAAVLREHSPLASRAIALEVLGRAARRRGAPSDLDRAADLLRQALALWRQADEPGRVAELRLRLAWVDRDMADLPRALERVRSVRDGMSPGTGLWIQAMIAEADFLCDTGHCHAAATVLARVHAVADDWLGPDLRAVAALVRARVAVHTGQTEEAAHWLTVAGDFRGRVTGTCGVRVIAGAAELWSRLGQVDQAEACVRLLRRLEVEPDLDGTIARAAVASRLGDAAHGLRALRGLLESGAVTPRERWRVVLLAAHAALRTEAPDAPALAGQALREATASGQPFAPFARERELAHEMLRTRRTVLGDAG